MKRAFVAVTAAALSVAASYARAEEYPLMLDPKGRAEAATVSITSGARLLLRADDEVLGRLEPRDRSAPSAILARVAAGVLVELPIASLELVLPHEIFGHGARIREFDGVPDVHLVLPPPYDFTGAKGDNVTPAYRRPITTDEATVVSLAGLRVQAMQQRHLAFTAFRAGELGRGDAVLYAGNVGLYVGQMLVAGDIDSAARSQRVSRTDYRRPYLVGLPFELLDPLLLYSLYSGAYRYLVRGERSRSFPEVRLGAWRVSATQRIVPVPWGVEHHLDLLAGGPFANLDVTLRTGVGSGSFGVDVAMLDVRLGRALRLGFEGSLFTQPGLASPFPASQRSMVPTISLADGTAALVAAAPSRVSGAAGYLRVEVVQPHWFFGARIGAKTAGLSDERALAAGGEALLLGGPAF